MDWFRQLSLQYRAPQAAVLAAPFFAQHYSASSFVSPPLGSLQIYAVPAATVVIFLCSLLPNLIENKQRAKLWLRVTVATAIVAFCVYSALVARYVISVETPANGIQTRSIGFRVEPRIKAQFPNMNDPQLLRLGGLEDWEIQKVWTPNSVLALRLILLLDYSVFFGLANVALGATERLKRKG